MSSAERSPEGHFVSKWLQREPEMAFAELFTPLALRPRFRAWGGLLHELREAAFELSDARVTEAKIGWWAEELLGLAEGRPRHPLTEALVGATAPWSALGRALLSLPETDRRYADTADALAGLRPLAQVVVEVEAALFEARSEPAAARALSVHWLLQRLPRGLEAEDRARIPLHLFARHGFSVPQIGVGEGDALLVDWARELRAALPVSLPGSAGYRRSRARFDAARLERLAAGKGHGEPPALATLWRAWRVARN